MTAPDYTIQCALGLNTLIMVDAIFYFFCISPRPLVGFEETVSKARFVRDSKNACPQKYSIFQCPIIICDSSSVQAMQMAASHSSACRPPAPRSSEAGAKQPPGPGSRYPSRGLPGTPPAEGTSLLFLELHNCTQSFHSWTGKNASFRLPALCAVPPC